MSKKVFTPQEKTYGQVLLETAMLEPEDAIQEYGKPIGRDVMKDIYATAQWASQHSLYKDNNFYVVNLLRQERVGGALQPISLARRSCPTPVYKQAVWKYHKDSGDLEFLWSIPDQFRFWDIINNQQEYLDSSEQKWRDMAKFVILMHTGELLDWVKKENGEKPDALIKINRETDECQN